MGEGKHDKPVEELKQWALERVRETAGWKGTESKAPAAAHVMETNSLQEELQSLGDDTSDEEAGRPLTPKRLILARSELATHVDTNLRDTRNQRVRHGV